MALILLTGGSGLLGQELNKHIDCYAPRRDIYDLVKDNPSENSAWRNAFFEEIELIVHCAAFTDLNRAEKEKQLCYDTNVIGTRNLASLGIPMLYISTSYVFDGQKGNYDEQDYPSPQNFYSLTKLLGEYESRRTRSVVIRCLFKPYPFEHDRACTDQWTSGMYVSEMAKEIALAVTIFDKLPETVHIGATRKSTFEFARESRPDVKPISIGDIKSVRLPQDVSLNVSLWEKIKSENQLCGDGLRTGRN